MIRCSVRTAILCTLASLWLGGCKADLIPDPNERVAGESVSGTALLQNVNLVVSSLDRRLASGEIDQAKRDQLVELQTRKLLAEVNPLTVPPDEAWQFGDAFRLAGDWKAAQALYEQAVKAATTDDRRVNDSLRLARVLAHRNQVARAITLCRSVFDVPPKERAPILMSVLYEIVPEARDKGSDLELAELVEAAIARHESVLVDPSSRAGKEFLSAKRTHIHKAWMQAARLYQSAGKDDQARHAIEQDEASARNQASI